MSNRKGNSNALSEGRCSASCIQVCAEQDAVAEATIHAMYYLHQQDEVEAILLVDAENAFDSINRK